MATVYKATTMFQLTTVVANVAYAVPHTGGWSESWWSLTDPWTTASLALRQLQLKRATLLPIQASIIGFRVQKYDMVGNQLKPLGSLVASTLMPGRTGIVTDVPSMALQLIVSGTNTPNKANMILRGIPDDYIQGGEYQPDPIYAGLMTQFRNQLTASGFGFVGRDRSQASTRVLSASLADGILVDGIPASGLVAGDWVRLNRVLSTTGHLIVGPFRVVSVVGSVVRVDNWPGGMVVDKPSGTLRRDQMVFVAYTMTNARRATTKKVGSPFEKYRGRRSKKRV